jgi:hypothetical protein
MNDESIEDVGTNWEFVTFTTGFFATRIIRCRKKNLIGTYTYKVQRKYPLFGWSDITVFNSEYNVGG